MSQWASVKARQVLSALLRIGWVIKRQKGGSHRVLSREGWPDYVFAFHDEEEMGPRMLARIAKHTGLRPEDLREPAAQTHLASRTQVCSYLHTVTLTPRRGGYPHLDTF